MKKLLFPLFLIFIATSSPARLLADIGPVKDEAKGDLRIDFVSSPHVQGNSDNEIDTALRRVVTNWLINHPNAHVVDARLSESSGGNSWGYRQARVMIIYREKPAKPESSGGKGPK